MKKANNIAASKEAIMSPDDQRRCTRCGKFKVLNEGFYMCQGRWRSECKVCTIKRNVRYQKKHKTWFNRNVDPEERRAYLRDYYKKNKAKYQEYRKKFLKRNPDYFKNYYRLNKEDEKCENEQV